MAANAIVSGTAAELGGGKFANGAVTGAFSMMFNDFMHKDPPQKRKVLTVAEQSGEEGGTFGAAMTLAVTASAIDGPLPIGDAVGAIILVGTAVYDEFNRVYLTYILTNAEGKVYVGRTSGFGSVNAIMKRRFSSHGRKAEGFGNSVIDRAAQGPDGYATIRGREQQLIDYYGGIGNPKLGNTIRGVSRYNPFGRLFHSRSNKYFGNIAPYTGF